MSTHSHSFLRVSISRFAITGAATLASVMSFAPAAVAADEPTSAEPSQSASPAEEPTPPPAAEPAPAPPEPEPEPEPEAPPAATPAEPESEPESPPAEAPAPVEDTPDETSPAVPVTEGRAAPTAPDASTEESAVAEAIAPDFGFQKFRVGIKIADGSYVADGTSPAGATFQIASTDAEGATTYDTCTATVVEGDTAYCPAPTTGVLERAAATPDVTVTPGNPFGPNFTAAPGATVTIEQTSAPEGLSRSTLVAALEPCENTDPLPCDTNDVVFENTGLAPVATFDDVDTEANTPVLIDVLANDESDDPATTIDVQQAPANGTAEVVTRDGRQQILYTPNTDFNGRETFSYNLTNSNGTSQASIRVDVGDVAPVYGSQKYRVGVQVADGSYVPEGTTTSGSEFTVTTTNQDGTSSSFTCTTGPAGGPPASASGCPGSGFLGSYTAPAGSTVTVVQATAAPGLVASTQQQTLEPCNVLEDPCGFTSVFSFDFSNTGLLPVVVDDEATTDEGEAVRIDVLANDESDDPATTLDLEADPSHGTATVVGQAAGARVSAVPSAGTLAIEYTPADGFSGEDTFEYAVTSSNGTSTGTVTVEVVPDDVDGTDPDGSADPGDDNDDTGVSDNEASPSDGATSDAALPDTGGADWRLLGLAGLLLGTGSVATAAGRRRRAGVHRA